LYVDQLWIQNPFLNPDFSESKYYETESADLLYEKLVSQIA